MDGPGAAVHNCTNYEAHHGTDEGRPLLHRLFPKISDLYVRTLIWPWRNRRPLTMSCRNCHWRSSMRCFSMRPRSWGCYMGQGFGRWRWPLLSCAEERLSRGSGYSVTESMRLGSARKLVQKKAQGPRRRSVSCPPHPLPEDFDVLCPYFSLAEAEATAVESGLPEIVQTTFYAMLLNDMLELSAVHEYTAKNIRSTLVDLGWSAFKA
ncbi:hypothetical protein Cgig2_000401 [Carnegiea gigantea]|uniref:Uncharacterized protein n=1 Tax=Carnegiea gigantea TaxID=171969 RepID=A0A9Q1QD73_9CARY|nr:hypothetical protein Cgig2_000401 [Carnegiea gigantea]